jgi:membrane protein DedA with SNARE-associated domain
MVGGIIGLESMGIPLPGEITLVSASLLTVKGIGSPWGVATAAAAGAIIGDSVGYAIGQRGGRPLLARLGRRFPKHLGPEQMERAEHMFARWGVWAVFFGRFIALLRILAGPMAGALRVPYRKFLIANASGGIVWAFGTVWAIYWVGEAAEQYLKRFQWAALVVVLFAGVVTTWWFKHRAKKVLNTDSGTDTGTETITNTSMDKNTKQPEGADTH